MLHVTRNESATDMVESNLRNLERTLDDQIALNDKAIEETKATTTQQNHVVEQIYTGREMLSDIREIAENDLRSLKLQNDILTQKNRILARIETVLNLNIICTCLGNLTKPENEAVTAYSLILEGCLEKLTAIGEESLTDRQNPADSEYGICGFLVPCVTHNLSGGEDSACKLATILTGTTSDLRSLETTLLETKGTLLERDLNKYRENFLALRMLLLVLLITSDGNAVKKI